MDSMPASSPARTALLEHPVPEELPVLPLREFVAFPYMVLPLFVARERSVAAVEDALAGNRLLLLVAQRDPERPEPGPEDLHRMGTVAMVMRSRCMADGRMKVLVQGLQRARIESFIEHEESTWVRTTPVELDEAHILPVGDIHDAGFRGLVL